MRKKVIAGNWKMYMDITGAVNLITGIKAGINKESLKCDVVICPPAVNLETANELVKNSPLALGAQNMYFEDQGAFTGEISAPMLKAVGCGYVILGHSERRTIFGEKDELINKKVVKALASDLTPIFCIGETLAERENGTTFNVVKTQITEGLKGVSADDISRVIVAYEPVWAIGTGKTASPEQAQEVHKYIRNLLSEMYGSDKADSVTIQYGGSVKPENAAELLGQPDIDGALVGGACLKADSFLAIISAV